MKRATTAATSLFLGFCLAPALLAQSVPLTADTYIAPASPTNFGAPQTVVVGSASGYQGLFLFDLSTLPAGATVSKATLILFVKTVTAAGTINISRANGTWTESGVNGINGPVAGAAVASGVSVSAINTFCTSTPHRRWPHGLPHPRPTTASSLRQTTEW